MRTRTTNSGLELSELSFGCGAIGGLYRAVSDLEADNVLNVAWDAGIRYFDVAPFYGHGRAEERLGRFLQTKDRSEYVVSTKVGKLLYPVSTNEIPDHNFVDPLPNGIRFDYSSAGIIESHDGSLARMGIDHVDIVFVHDLEPKSHSREDYDHHMSEFLADGINILDTLKSQGQIKAFGLGVNQVEPCIDVLKHRPLDIILLAGRYTLLDRSAEDGLLDLCEANGTDLVVGGVFNSGILATGPMEGAQFDYEDASDEVLEAVAKLQAALKTQQVELADAALKFPLSNPLVKSVLIGTAKINSLTRNLNSFDKVVSQSFEPAEKWPSP